MTAEWFALQERKPGADWEDIMSLAAWHDPAVRSEALAIFRESEDGPPGAEYRMVRRTESVLDGEGRKAPEIRGAVRRVTDASDAPWLRHLRTEVRGSLRDRRVTQASLAAHLGITPKHLNQVLGGHVIGSPDLLARMAEAVGLAIAIVVTDREPVPLATDRRPWLSGNRVPRGKAPA